MPMRGNGPMPWISSGFSPASIVTLSTMNHSGVIESPVPRRLIWMSTPSMLNGRPRKMTRR